MVRIALGLIAGCVGGFCLALGNPAVEATGAPRAEARLKIEVKLSTPGGAAPVDGRLFVVLGAPSGAEPRTEIGQTGLKQPPVLARDVARWSPGSEVGVDAQSALSPLRDLADLPTGEYRVQAVLATNRDLLLPNAPGNWYSKPVVVHLDPAQRAPVRVVIDQQLPVDSLPKDTEHTRFVKFRSEVLTKFWGRPMFLRVGVILPAGFDSEPTRRYPLLVRIGGYGSRYDLVERQMAGDSEFRKNWMAPDTKRFVVVQLDGAGPLGDPYQVDSANHGPYGTALVEELIPYIESTFRCIGQPHARFTAGGSTGGWVSLALQVFYPDYFGGCWSGYPDPLDFRAMQLMNLYQDRNAFVNGEGFERPSARELNGDTKFTMRHEMQVENVLGWGDSYIRSGGQWGAWNATFSPRGKDGLPVPIWDSRTGAIDPVVAEHWKKYDLRQLLADHWTDFAPRLRGKIHVWVGDADDYFLDGGVRLFEDFLKASKPAIDARIEYGSQKRHGWHPRTFVENLAEMQSAVEANAPKGAQAGLDYLKARFGHAANCPNCKGTR
jgi:S-formylglutathione hydrolase FrmB